MGKMSVSWSNHFKNLKTAFREDCRLQKFVDVTLVCERRMIHGHRVVLAASSSYFSNILEENPCQHPIIILPRNMEFWTIEALVKFIYTGEVSVSEEYLEELMLWAEELQIRGFRSVDDPQHTETSQHINEDKQENEFEALYLHQENEARSSQQNGLVKEIKTEKMESNESENLPNQIKENEDCLGYPSTSFSSPRDSTESKNHSLNETNYFNTIPIKVEPNEDYVEEREQNLFLPNFQPAPDPNEQRPLIRKRIFKNYGSNSPPKNFTPSYNPEDMRTALTSVQRGMSIYQAAKLHKVPKTTLRKVMKRSGVKSSIAQPQPLKKYNLAQREQKAINEMD